MHENFKKDLAEALEIDPAVVTEDYDLASSGMWDSMAVVGTIAVIDEHFGKTVSGDALQECETVGDVMRLIERTA